jgi:hypothetical protein
LRSDDPRYDAEHDGSAYATPAGHAHDIGGSGLRFAAQATLGDRATE